MSRLFACIVFLLALVTATTTTAQSNDNNVDFSAIDRFMNDQLAAQRIPGASLVITHDGEVVHLRGYGEARPGEPVTPQTQFFIGSVSKSFTALAVMQLVEQGRVELDAPVQTYVPEFAPSDARAAQVTVRHLLNMSSGLSDRGFPDPTTSPDLSISDYVRLLADAQFVAQPGTRFHYFNPNYVVLARLIERVSEQPFDAYMRDSVFTPLGMTNTVEVRHTGAMPAVPNLAQGHTLFFTQPIALAEQPWFVAGAGGIVSTAEDMGRYLLLHTQGGQVDETRLVSAESIAQMHTPQGDPAAGYGLGWFQRPGLSPRLIEHSGGVQTMTSDMVWLPDSDYAFVLLMNRQHFLSVYTAFPQLKNGLVALLSGSQPGGGLTAQTLGIGLLVVMVVNVALELRGLFRVPAWGRQVAGKRFAAIVPTLLSDLLGVLVLLLLPTLSGLLLDRVPTYQTLLIAMPDVMLWLGLGALIGLLRLIARIWVWQRNRQMVARAASTAPA
jgi:CubicO group peptidase (beta-lactamase class C family)